MSVAGRIEPMTLADVITARTAAYTISVDGVSRTIVLDFQDRDFIAVALASDCGRFSCASFQTASLVPQELEARDSFAWALIKLYYSAFYAGHALIRALGEGCSFFYKRHADRLMMVSDALGVALPFRIETGLYHCLLADDATAISFLRAHGVSGGAHEAFWLIFGRKMQNVANAVLAGPLLRSDAQAVFAKIDALLEILNRKSGYGWLSSIRNEIQYRLQHGAWYPERPRQQIRHGLAGLARGWAQDPMQIDVQAADQRFALLGEFTASCTFVIALCREITDKIADASSEGARSFVRTGGPVTFLNEIAGQ